MRIADRVTARLRREVAALHESRPARPWLVVIDHQAGVPDRRRTSPADISHRVRWSSVSGTTRVIPSIVRSVHVDAPDVAALADFGRDAVATTRARRVRIQVAAWRSPAAGWTGRMGPIPGIGRVDARFPRAGSGRVLVRVQLNGARPVREVIAAVLELLVPGASMPYAQSASVGSQAGLPAWLAPGADVAANFAISGPTATDGTVVDVVSGVKRGPGNPPPSGPATDTELVLEGGTPRGFGVVPTTALSVMRHGLVVEGVPAPLVLLDVHGRPTRRWVAPKGAGASGRLECRDTDDGPRWRLGVSELAGPWLGMDAPIAASGRPDATTCWSLTCDIDPGVSSIAAAALLVRLALSGVVLDGQGLSGAILAHLSAEFAAVLVRALPTADEDALVWETRSVHQRRAVIRGHATSLVLPDRIRPDAAVAVAPPTVTALLVSRRPKLAALALRMLRDQTYPSLDIIVGLHGVASCPELEAEVARAVQQVRIVLLPADASLGESLGLATGHATGSLLAKIDDDDIYGPEHIWDLVMGRALSGAAVVGKGAEFVMLDQMGITVRRDVMTSDVFDRVVAGGTLMVARGDLEALGGWRPVRAGVDRAMLDRVLQAGGLVYKTWPIGFIYRRHGAGHTWAAADDYFMRGVGTRWDGLPDLPEFGTRHVRDAGDLAAELR
ncbi:MAG: glycosyltransferase [Chloroflexi bacterium]|nr:glycosyltransferase [Chloroflexota bacterium]